MIESEFIIKEPKIPWFNKILFSLLSTGYIALIIYHYNKVATEKFTSSNIYGIIFYLIFLLGILIYHILPIVSRNYIHLNFTELKIKSSYSIGIFNFEGKWKSLKDLNYISVFNNNNLYEVNLWLKQNKILNLFASEDFDEVLKKAFYLSEKLNIELLDARKRGYHKWVNKTVYEKTGIVEHTD